MSPIGTEFCRNGISDRIEGLKKELSPVGTAYLQAQSTQQPSPQYRPDGTRNVVWRHDMLSEMAFLRNSIVATLH